MCAAEIAPFEHSVKIHTSNFTILQENDRQLPDILHLRERIFYD